MGPQSGWNTVWGTILMKVGVPAWQLDLVMMGCERGIVGHEPGICKQKPEQNKEQKVKQ